MEFSFFKHNQETVKDDVVAATMNFFSTGKILKEANKTHILLILKNADSRTIKEYRPISLCNLVYKFIMKGMANRLQKILPFIILHNQSAFVKGKTIADALLLANEIMHDFNRPGVKPKMCFKADFTKAYDSLRWDYIMLIIKRIGFPDH